MCVAGLRRAAPARELRAARLAEENQRLAVHVVMRFGKGRLCRDDWQDALGVAHLALVRAAWEWNQNRGVRFGTLAFKVIWRDLREFFEKKRRGGLLFAPKTTETVGLENEGRVPCPRSGEDEAVLDDAGESALVRKLLDGSGLTDAQRGAVVGMVLKDRTAREHAALEGVTKQAVDFRKNAGLAKIKAQMISDMDLNPDGEVGRLTATMLGREPEARREPGKLSPFAGVCQKCGRSIRRRVVHGKPVSTPRKWHLGCRPRETRGKFDDGDSSRGQLVGSEAQGQAHVQGQV